MENSWVMLARVLRVVPVESQAEHAVVEEPEHAAGGEGEQAAQAQAEHPAVGGAEDDAAWEGEDDAAEEAEIVAQALLEERVVGVDAVPAAAAANNLGEPGFIFSVAPPPRVVFLTARHSAHPDPPRRHTYPYFIASGPFCLLAHFAASPHYGMDFRRDLTGRRHLIVVRHFRRAGGQIVATAERVPDRPHGVPALRNIQSVGLLCDGYSRRRTYNYRIAELVVNTGRINPSLELVYLTSATANWITKKGLRSPLVDWNRYREWVPHGAVALDSTVLWFDLSWGILSCDPENHQRADFGFVFCRLPRGRALRDGEATAASRSAGTWCGRSSSSQWSKQLWCACGPSASGWVSSDGNGSRTSG